MIAGPPRPPEFFRSTATTAAVSVCAPLLMEQSQMRIATIAATMALGLLLAATTAFATPPATALQTDVIRSQQAQIKAGLDARTGAYKDLPAPARAQLLSEQAWVLGLIEGKQSTDDLDDAKKGELFAALGSIDAMVSKANDDRMVCQLQKTLGSNRKERVCRTAGQIRAEREAVRDQLDRGGMQSVRGG